jgi:hypothetical protein
MRSILAPRPNSSFSFIIFSRDFGFLGIDISISGIATSNAQPTNFGAMAAY